MTQSIYCVELQMPRDREFLTDNKMRYIQKDKQAVNLLLIQKHKDQREVGGNKGTALKLLDCFEVCVFH